MAIKHRPTADAQPDTVLSQKEVHDEPEVKGSKQVKVDADKIVDEKVTIDFMSDGFSQDHAKKKTKEHIEHKSSIPADKPVGEIREDIKKAEADRSGDKFTFKDILQIATFLINAFDGGISILLNFIARDNRVSVYSLPAETKRQLSEQLALILVKYQVKFKIEFLFFITLVLAYMGPVAGSLKRRKNGPIEQPPKEKPKKDPVVNQEVKTPKSETTPQEKSVEEVLTNGTENPTVPVVPRETKRKYTRVYPRGGQRKATL